jgi:predicted O-methyltransferase YrrM
MQLKIRKIQAVLTAFFIVAFVVAWVFIGELACGILLLLSIAISIFVQVELHNRSIRLRAQDYQQIESLFSVFSQIRFNAPMPKTRGSSVAPDFIAMLIGLVQDKKPKVIMELGSGTSTILSAYTLQSIGSGRVISLDHEEKYVSITQENLIRHNLQDIVTVIHAPLKKIKIKGSDYLWYDVDSLKNIGQIDMLIVDGPPHIENIMERYPALPLLIDRLTSNAVVILDDARRKGEKKIIEAWLKEYDCLSAEYSPLEHGDLPPKK